MHQDEIDAQAIVPAKCTLAIVPPAEGFLGLLEVAERIHESELRDARERGALFGTHVHAADPRRRVVHVAILGSDVEIAQHHEAGMLRGFVSSASA